MAIFPKQFEEDQHTRGPVNLGTTGSFAGEAFAFGVAGFRFLGDGDASLAVPGLVARFRLERVIGEEAILLYKKRDMRMTVYEQEINHAHHFELRVVVSTAGRAT